MIMQWFKYLFVTALLLSAAWVIWDNNPQIHHVVQQYVENDDFLTLEAKFTAEQIMAAHRKELLTSPKHVFQDPVLKFYPYLLLDIKYTKPDKSTREGVVLWSQFDGEMVLNTENWEKTHGFEDAIKASASRSEFMILNALAKHQGSLSREKLQQELHLEGDTLEPWIDSARQKHLIIQKGNELQLHFQNPKILVAPETKITQTLVSKPFSTMHRMRAKYGQHQIEKIAKAAFGHDFTIREIKEVFLPVYRIEVLNPDGSIFTSYWNALNGQKIAPAYLTS
jgi:hypothetical protein